MRKIIFLSALDFKEKSIQVIRKTPEAYRDKGWQVDYVVARDERAGGNYFYEKELNPNNINVYRTGWPLNKVRCNSNRYISLVSNKIASFMVVAKLFFLARKLLKSNRYDVVYGYELQGVLAANLLKFFSSRNSLLVSRFQGTFLNEMFEKKQFARQFFNLDLIFAIWLPSNIKIMTNDGTQGDKAIMKICGNKAEFKFWVNGVDEVENPSISVIDNSKHIELLTVSRLVGWKRVDRAIDLLEALISKSKKQFRLTIIGDGSEKKSLIRYASSKGLDDYIRFIGSVNHKKVDEFMSEAHFFISMYESSNVGNPLLESMRKNVPVVTLSNGDTSEWVKHNVTGLIYNEEEISYELIAEDIVSIVEAPENYNEMKMQLSTFADAKLWTWDERLSAEVSLVEKLVCEK